MPPQPLLCSTSRSNFPMVTPVPNKNWDFYIISKNIDLNDINKIPEKHINMMSICFNQNLTWKYISENPKLKWDFDIISYNKTVTWNIIKNNPNYFNNYYYISCNRNIDFDIFYNNFLYSKSFFKFNKNIYCIILKLFFKNFIYLYYLQYLFILNNIKVSVL